MINIDLSNKEKFNSEEVCQDTFPKVPGIYFCYCKSNGKGYVGQSINLYSRVRRTHIPQLRRNKHKNEYWQNSWNKYGEENFIWMILEYCSQEELNKYEEYWIKELNTQFPNGFNKTSGGDNCFTLSNDSCKKMSDAWNDNRKQELGKRTKEKWASMSDDEYYGMCKKMEDAWNDERRKLISSQRYEYWKSLSDNEKMILCEKMSKNHYDCSGDKNPRARTIRCLETKEIFTTIKEAAKYFGINYSTLKGHLNGKIKNVKGYHFEYVTKE